MQFSHLGLQAILKIMNLFYKYSLFARNITGNIKFYNQSLINIKIYLLKII